MTATKSTPKKNVRPTTTSPGTGRKRGEREIRYPNLKCVIATVANGEPITVGKAQELLGWETTTGKDFLLTDVEGNRIVCTNNLRNRPLYMSNVETLVQEHLQKRWLFNGEPIIIGKTGVVVNGQHSLISLVLAEQERTIGRNAHHWQKHWPDPVTMDKLIVYGIDEDDATINTMDTAKPRSLTDVVYRSEFFAKKRTDDRKVLAKMVEQAVRFLWVRTGANKDDFAKRRTHAESLDFLTRHNRILQAVSVIYDSMKEARRMDGKEGISDLFHPGLAAGILWLMGASGSDPGDYRGMNVRSDRKLDWSNWDRAVEFWDMVVNSNETLSPLRMAIGAMGTLTEGGDTAVNRVAVCAKAWHPFLVGDSITHRGLKLHFLTSEAGITTLAENPTFGGVDLGFGKPGRPSQVHEDDGEEVVIEHGA